MKDLFWLTCSKMEEDEEEEEEEEVETGVEISVEDSVILTGELSGFGA